MDSEVGWKPAELPDCELQPKVQLDSTLVSTPGTDTGASSFSPRTWLMVQIIYSYTQQAYRLLKTGSLTEQMLVQPFRGTSTSFKGMRGQATWAVSVGEGKGLPRTAHSYSSQTCSGPTASQSQASHWSLWSLCLIILKGRNCHPKREGVGGSKTVRHRGNTKASRVGGSP